MAMRRVVITGLGMVTPLACGVEETWARLVAGQSGAGKITRFDASHLATGIACEVPVGDGSDGTFNADDWMAPKDQRKVDSFILFAVTAAVQALNDAGWAPEDEEDRLRTGVIIGSGIGGLATIAETSIILKEKGPRRVSPFFIPGSLINLASSSGFQPASVSACSAAAMANRMKLSTLRWSFGAIQSSGLKEPSLPSPKGTSQAIVVAR